MEVTTTTMPLDDILEEIDTLRAIFCQDGEFCLHSDLDSLHEANAYSISFSINVNVNVQTAYSPSSAASSSVAYKEPKTVNLVLSVSIDCKYPDELESISVTSTDMTRAEVDTLKAGLVQYIGRCFKGRGEPMILDIVQWMKENTERFIVKGKERIHAIHQQSSGAEEQGKPNVSSEKCFVLKLDHMRAKQKYKKTIISWMNELNLYGRLIFFKKSIWIVVYGKHETIREYIKLHRSQNVDVDSGGRPCKERMMSILLEFDCSLSNHQ